MSTTVPTTVSLWACDSRLVAEKWRGKICPPCVHSDLGQHAGALGGAALGLALDARDLICKWNQEDVACLRQELQLAAGTPGYKLLGAPPFTPGTSQGHLGSVWFSKVRGAEPPASEKSVRRQSARISMSGLNLSLELLPSLHPGEDVLLSWDLSLQGFFPINDKEERNKTHGF